MGQCPGVPIGTHLVKKRGAERACSVVSGTLRIPFSTKPFLFFILTPTAVSRSDDMDP